MHDLSLYEKKMIIDEEFPVQMFENRIAKPGCFCQPHWHEHLELHYILKGECIFYCNQQPLLVKEGSLAIINSNELHEGVSQTKDFHALVIIFEMRAFSKEIADYNVIFNPLIKSDPVIKDLVMSIYNEENEKSQGFKLAIKGKLYELIAYLFRNYVAQSLSDRENISRIKNLSRLNKVLKYIQENYTDIISNKELADMMHVSEFRFCHLFKESVGKSPLNYINEVRLKKAYYLLEQKEMTVAQISSAVGFQDYNNFGRLFRKYYGYAPTRVWNE